MAGFKPPLSNRVRGTNTSHSIPSGNQIKCTLTLPETDKVSNLETQVQVQTVYGVSRSATVAFPTCAAACQNNGTCWWSKDAIALECVCANYLYYGAQCQNSASFPRNTTLGFL